MPTLDHRAFINSVKLAKKFSSLYLFVGEEDTLLDQCRLSLQKSFFQVFPESNNDFNFERFYGDRAEPAAIAESCATFPLGSSMKLIIVHHLEKMSETKRSELAELLQKEDQPSTALVMLWGTKPSATALNHALTLAVEKNGVVVKCWKPFENQRPEWIKEEVQSKGKSIALDACKLLSEEGGESLSDLKSEIEKCFLYVGEKKQIELQEVRTILSFGRARTIWNFLDFLESGDIRRAAQAMEDCLDQGEEPVKLIAMIAKTLRSSQNPAPSWTPFPKQNKPRKQWNDKQLSGLIPFLKEMDLAFKSGQSRESAQLEILLEKLAHNS